MKLYYSPASPYARKVRMVAFEAGLFGEIEDVIVDPFSSQSPVFKLNPLGKIPVLLSREQVPLYDSRVICSYLASLSTGNSLNPVAGPDFWMQASEEALAEGLADSCYNLVMERRRPQAEQSSASIEQWAREIDRALQHLNGYFSGDAGPVSMAQLGLAASLGYLELRLPDLLDADRYPGMTAWYRHFDQRPCMLATRPVVQP